MGSERTYIDGARLQDVTKEGVVVGGTELGGIAGILWDVRGGQATARRDSDVIYRLYCQENQLAERDEPPSLQGRCFISEPQRPYDIGETVMLEMRDGQRFFGTVRHTREMRTGSVSLILDIEK